jgi:ABC-type sugar transport system ATPase subunit
MPSTSSASPDVSTEVGSSSTRKLAPSPQKALGLEVVAMTKRFGALMALDAVSLRTRRGLHALLGENGAGKSMLVTCIMGYITGAKKGR